MRYTYLIIDALVLLVPLLYSFDSRIRYYRCFPALGLSIVVVGFPYLAWDALVTHWGEWSFNSRYVTGVELFNLPVGEILFFVTVPYSCLFIYELVAYYREDQRLRLPAALFAVIGLLLVALSAFVHEQGYTMKALLSCAGFFFCALLIKREFVMSQRYWVWLGICYIPFLVVNTLLTALPVVQYNPRAIQGPRIGTIPVEDFFYNFAMLSFYGLFYVLFKDWQGVRRSEAGGYNGPRQGKALLAVGESRAAER